MSEANHEALREAGRRSGELNKLPQRRIENRERNKKRLADPVAKKEMVLRWEKGWEKMRGVPKTEAHKAALRGLRPHVNQTGSRNNNAKKIETPFGVFASIADATIALTEMFTRNQIFNRLDCMNGWRRIS